MFLLPSLLLGLVVAVVLGGKPSRLLEVRIRLSWLVPAAFAIQVIVFSRFAAGLPEPAHDALHIGSYALLIAFAVANARLRALTPVIAGMLLNSVAIVANGGRMPVSASAARAAGLPATDHSNLSPAAHHLHFLGDVFALPARLPFANVFSVGDLLIGFGMVAFIVLVSIDDGRESPVSAGRLAEPFRQPAFRMLAAGKLISHVGDWLIIASLVGWIYSTTGSTGQVAGLMLIRMAPPILGGSVAALVVDRLPKGRLLTAIELGRGAAAAGALAGVVTGDRPVVYVALAASGALAAMNAAAVRSLVPSLVASDQFAAANAGLGIAENVAMAAGSIGAGIALSSIGVSAALAADLVTFAAAAVIFARLRVPAGASARRAGRSGALAGLRYLLGRRNLLLLVLAFAAATLATGLANATLPRFLETRAGLGAGGYGFGFAALALGLALGEGSVGFTRAGANAGRWIGTALVAMAGLFGLLALTVHAPTALLVLGAIGFVDGTTDVVFDTVVQSEADPSYYGCVFGFAAAFITTTMMASVAIAPFANAVLPADDVVLGASAFLVAAGVIALVGTRRPRAAPVLRAAADAR